MPNYHSYTPRVLEYCGLDCLELAQEPRLDHHLAPCIARKNELQRICLISTHGGLPAHIRDRSFAQFQHSWGICRTVWGPYPHWHLSVSVLLAWRYARRLIFPVRICVMTELIALCVPMCVVSVCFPRWTPSSLDPEPEELSSVLGVLPG